MKRLKFKFASNKSMLYLIKQFQFIFWSGFFTFKLSYLSKHCIWNVLCILYLHLCKLNHQFNLNKNVWHYYYLFFRNFSPNLEPTMTVLIFGAARTWNCPSRLGCAVVLWKLYPVRMWATFLGNVRRTSGEKEWMFWGEILFDWPKYG